MLVKLEFIEEPIYTHGFPWRVYTEDEIVQEFYKLRQKLNKEDITFPIKISYIGYKCTDYFFQIQRLNVESDTNMSCIEYWKKRKDKILDYHKKQKCKKDLFGTIVFMKRAPSHFSPFVAAMIYRYFSATKIVDPYAGWGDRCLAAIALNIDYIGIDSNTQLASSYRRLIDTFPHHSNVEFISDKSENIDLAIYEPDLIFSSPPFWNNKRMVEKYPHCEIEFQTFFQESLTPLFDTFINKIPIVLYINDYMYQKIKSEFQPASQILQFGSSTVKKDKKEHSKHNIYCWIP